jgi:predicted patatin/cPLA2 family phospholipase
MVVQGKNSSGFKLESVRDELVFYASHGRFRERTRMAVVFEGGALRGVISCGFAMALEEFVSPPSFPILAGASSGALNEIYFACSMSKTALDIYAENATDRRCTNIWNFPNILNVDWLLDEWIFKGRMFDFEKINKSQSDIFISLSNLNDGSAKYANARGLDIDTLNKVLKATAYSPLLTNARQQIWGEPYGDGLVSAPIPYDKAVVEGATHVICLLTRPPSYRKQSRFLFSLAERLRLLGHTKEYLRAYFRRHLIYNSLLERLYVTHQNIVPTLVLHPANSDEAPGNIGNDPQAVRAFGLGAYNNAKSVFEEILSGTTRSA